MTINEPMLQIIDQINQLIKKLDTNTYSKPLELFNGSSIGEHFRHIYDFYNCLAQADSSRPLDYSKRERNPQLEKEPSFAIAAFTEVKSELRKLPLNHPLKVTPDAYEHSSVVREILVPSSFGRELMYAYDHAIHHLAIIKIGLKHYFPEVLVSEEVGVAPSTIRYQETGNGERGTGNEYDA